MWLRSTVLCQKQHAECFRCFKNTHFDINYKECLGVPKKFDVGGITSWWLIAIWTCRIIRNWSQKSFEKHLKVWKMILRQGHWVPYELKRSQKEISQKTFFYVWASTLMAEKGSFFASFHECQMKNVYFLTTLSEESCGIS